jgi:NADH:ubiquinone oxidoreductase subunit F (NADH-binding)/NADH:ubiquinone oxidoreductase subunit E/NAD-dependent dihydropyrimidine dehydrogenase PreA subunit
MPVNLADIDLIIAQKGRHKSAVIPILQAIQDKHKYLPDVALKYVCDHTDITAAQITSVSSFYSKFRHEEVGKHIIKVCVGTACHVKGASRVYDAFKRHFSLEDDHLTDATKTYTLDEVSCLGCCTLAPVVQIDDVTYGHVTTSQVKEVLSDFEAHLADKERHLVRHTDGSEIKGEIRIGLGSCCVASGSDEIKQAVEKQVYEKELNVKLKHVGCVGMCHQVPLLEIVPENQEPVLYAKVKPGDVKTIVQNHFETTNFWKRLKNKLLTSIETVQSDEHWNAIERYELNVREKPVTAFLGKQIPIATAHRGVINPLDIDEYLSHKGFKALEKVLSSMTQQDVIDQVKKSGIKGRGGGGFPTGIKWSLVASEKASEKYIICNGDEGDPGAFMDRMLLESYPYRVIEGMLIAAFAIGATQGYFYIRAEYPLAVNRINQALDICREKGYLGENILNSGFNIDFEIYEGAGAFVCGEETAMIASIEGNRGFPTLRPPYPAEKGLWNKPTLINNTETLAQISYILLEGAEAFNRIGTDNSKGTKVFALAGKVTRGGLIEVPMGITIKQVVDEIGGGVANGRQFKAVQIGGPSGGCIPYWLEHTPIDFDSLQGVGAMMGSGGLVVLDNTDCMVDMARYFLSFTQDESCGKCTFCRVGTRRMLDILEDLTQGKGKMEDLDELENLARWTQKGSLCGLGKTAPNPVLSTLKYFRDEYEAHINGVCPTGSCKDLISYQVADNCIGCTKCVRECPVEAIPFTPHVVHTINNEKCIKCDACRQICPVDAISVLSFKNKM